MTLDSIDAGLTRDPACAPEPSIATSRREESVWRYLGLGLSGALLVLVIALGVALIVLPKIAGATPLTVLTSSMEPGLPPGTLIIVRPADPNALRIGDVVTYQMHSGKAAVITHRIISITSSSDGTRSFIMQGDNNSAPDAEAVLAEQVQGRLWYSVPFIGYVNNAVNGANKAWIIPVAAVGLFGYAGYMIAGGALAAARKRRSSRARTSPRH